MKKSIVVSILTVLLISITFVLSGCSGFWDQPDKTAAEVNRNHMRMLNVNQQELNRDFDRALFLDEPHGLIPNMRVPPNDQ